MPPIAFRDCLREIREYMALAPGTKARRRAFAALCEKLPDAETFEPQVKKWERIAGICLLAALLGFVSLIALCIIAFLQGRALFSPVQQKACYGFMALYILPQIPMVYADMRKKRMAKDAVEREIHRFGERLGLLSEDRFARVWALLNSDPEYPYGDEPPVPGDTCGCCACGCIFPADAPGLNWTEGFPCCPCCDSPVLVYGTAEIPVEKETLLLIHNLLFEEK